MGVMRCNRKGCDRIMCDRYSSEHGYICNDCFEELGMRATNIYFFMHAPKHNDEGLWQGVIDEEFKRCEDLRSAD